MKTGNKTLAMALLTVFLASGCAAVSPPVAEQEEELTTEEKAALEEKKIEERIEMRSFYDDGSSDAE